MQGLLFGCMTYFLTKPAPAKRSKMTFVSAIGLICFLFSMAVLVENAIVIMLYHYKEAYM